MPAPLSSPEPIEVVLSDGYRAHARLWRTEHAAQSTLYLHGIQSHGGWFEWSASVLAAAGGGNILLPDRRGSGLNHQARGDTPDAGRWLIDLDDWADFADRRLGAPVTRVVGVSWGGKLAVCWSLERCGRIQRLLLIAPGLCPAVGVPLRRRLLIAGSLLTSPTRMFEIPLSDPRLFTENAAGQQFIAEDPLKLTEATARFLYHSTRLDWKLRRVRPGALRVPTTLILADVDRIIRNDRTRQLVDRLTGDRGTAHVLRLAAHTIEFEPDLGEFTQLLEAWAG